MARKKGVEIYRENPFMTGLTMSTKQKRITVKANKAIIDTDTGEVENVAEIVQIHTVDNDQFVKLFTTQLKTFFDLSLPTFKMLQVVLHQLQQVYNNDTIFLDIKAAEEYFLSTSQKPIARSSFFRSIRELIDKKFIAATERSNFYYINPTLFFNGDRFRFVTEYHRGKAKKPTPDKRQMDLLTSHTATLEQHHSDAEAEEVAEQD